MTTAPIPPPSFETKSFESFLDEALAKLNITDPIDTDATEGSPEWGRNRPHLLIMNESGLPVHSLHGDEHSLGSFFGVVSATIGLISSIGDSLSSTNAALSSFNPNLIEAGTTNVAFFYKQSLIFALVSSLPPPILHHQLSLVHGLITSLLTGIRVSVEQKKLCNYLSSSKNLFENLLNMLSSSLTPYFGAVESPLFTPSLASQLTSAMSSTPPPSILFSMVCTLDLVVSLACAKNVGEIHEFDLTLLLNLIQCQTTIHKQGVSNLLPFCFTFTSSISKSWVYLNIECVSEEDKLFIVVGTSKAKDSELLFNYSRHLKSEISSILPALSKSLIKSAIVNWGVLGLRHFVCYFPKSRQFLSGKFDPPLHFKSIHHQIIRKYLEIHGDLCFSHDNQIDFSRLKNGKVVVQKGSPLGTFAAFGTSDYVLYTLFDCFIDSEVIIEGCDQLIHQLKANVAELISVQW
ncbi:hypothetical protein P9112_007934 [Eukaryota sp. TZLM1-RC]